MQRSKPITEFFSRQMKIIIKMIMLILGTRGLMMFYNHKENYRKYQKFRVVST